MPRSARLCLALAILSCREAPSSEVDAEASAAMLRGDLRYLAICRSTCVLPGMPGDTVCFLEGCFNARPSDVRAIDGTDSRPMNADGARLDSVATAYGTRYNQIIRAYRKRQPPSRPVT